MKMLNTLGTPTNAIWPGSEAFTYADQFNVPTPPSPNTEYMDLSLHLSLSV